MPDIEPVLVSRDGLWSNCLVLCCAVLCCAVLCCAVLCCAVLCCAVLCCAVLCPAGKKEALANVGGLLCCNDDKLFEQLRNLTIVVEGYPTQVTCAAP
jgi:hypothetical protein